MSHSQSKTMKKTRKSFSSSSFGLSVPILIISTLTLFPFTHGFSLRFRDPAGLDSCQEPFSKISLTGSTSLNRLYSLTHLLSNINPSVITVGNSSLLSVCGSCSTQNHTFLRIWKIAASCLQLFSFLRAALSKRLPPLHGHPLSLLEWSRTQEQRGPHALTTARRDPWPARPCAAWQELPVLLRSLLHPEKAAVIYREHPFTLGLLPWNCRLWWQGLLHLYKYSLVSLKCKQTQTIPVFTTFVIWAKYCCCRGFEPQKFHIWSAIRELKKKKSVQP